MLRNLSIQDQACSCLWQPCRCLEIERMTPQARVDAQDAIARKYLQTANQRTAAQRRDAVLGARAERFGMDGQTAEQRERPRTLSQVMNPAGFQIPNHPIHQVLRDMPCVQCQVKDERVQILDVLGHRIPVHEGNCLARYRLAQKSQAGY